MAFKFGRSKSLSSLTSEDFPTFHILRSGSCYKDKFFGTASDSDCSVEVYVEDDSVSASEDSGERQEAIDKLEDSGLGLGYCRDEISVLEHKLDRLSELFQEQCQLLSSIKGDMQPPQPSELPSCDFDLVIAPRIEQSSEDTNMDAQARSLLDAIELKSAGPAALDRAVKEALTDFLQSEEFKEQLVSRTAKLMCDSVSSWLSHDVSQRYVPLLKRHSCQLLRQVTGTLDNAFAALKEATIASKHGHRPVAAAGCNIRGLLLRHQQQLEQDMAKEHADLPAVVEMILKQELLQWRTKVMSLFEESPSSAPPTESLLSPGDQYVPSSPPQPADPEISIIDQLLESAMITKAISEGDINSSFVRALSASDLSLVMSACRAADPDTIFTQPCKLEPEVMLSLMQQLATDMVHDTQLKCLYLESCIASLDATTSCARAHLPVVVASISRHLTRFLETYPAHFAARRVKIILLAIGHFAK